MLGKEHPSVPVVSRRVAIAGGDFDFCRAAIRGNSGGTIPLSWPIGFDR